jgi:hypothetical protein
MRKQITQVQKNKIMANKLQYFTQVHYQEDEIKHSQHKMVQSTVQKFVPAV